MWKPAWCWAVVPRGARGSSLSGTGTPSVLGCCWTCRVGVGLAPAALIDADACSLAVGARAVLLPARVCAAVAAGASPGRGLPALNAATCARIAAASSCFGPLEAAAAFAAAAPRFLPPTVCHPSSSMMHAMPTHGYTLPAPWARAKCGILHGQMQCLCSQVKQLQAILRVCHITPAQWLVATRVCCPLFDPYGSSADSCILRVTAQYKPHCTGKGSATYPLAQPRLSPDSAAQTSNRTCQAGSYPA